MRAHGQSSKCLDFDIKNLVSDALMVLNSIACNHEAIIDVFLIGHSLGAAVLSQLRDIAELDEKNKFNFAGLVMIDIIEGINDLMFLSRFHYCLETAINSLSRMPDIIKEIPKSFATLDDATKWTLTSSHSHHNPQAASKQIASIKDSLASQMYFNEDSNRFEWIVDLSTMQDFWNSWFDGLTKNFLKFPGSRLLVLADTDYMDREMIIAQMQGKFQLVIVRESGHAIQEDRPIELAECLVELIQKHLKLSEILRNKKLN